MLKEINIIRLAPRIESVYYIFYLQVVSPAINMSDSIIRLNVGGVYYTTTKATLCRHPDSMLGAMFNGSMPTTIDEDGRYFIDRDGSLFLHVLNYLRSARLALPDDFKLLDPLMAEADFFQIEPLIRDLMDLKKRGYVQPTNETGVLLEVCINAKKVANHMT